MTLWITIAIIAYMLFALSAVADKFLLSHVERHPAVYAFYIGITGPLSFVLAPFGLQMLSAQNLFIAVFAGISFTMALYFLYSAIKQTSVSRILPIEGGLVPLFTLIMAYIILGERLTNFQYLAFIFLVVGAVMISFRYERKSWHVKALKNATLAAMFFGISFTLTKFIFEESNFISGMVWTRVGFFVAALSLLAAPKIRGYILAAPGKAKRNNIILYYSSRATGTLGGFLQNYAISLGSVSIVNALQGVQFTFLLALTIILSMRYPQILKERINAQTITIKLVAFALITTGLYLLTLT